MNMDLLTSRLKQAFPNMEMLQHSDTYLELGRVNGVHYAIRLVNGVAHFENNSGFITEPRSKTAGVIGVLFPIFSSNPKQEF